MSTERAAAVRRQPVRFRIRRCTMVTTLRDTVADYRMDCRARRVSPATIKWYQQKLDVAVCALEAAGVTTVEQLTSAAQLHIIIADLDDGTRSGQTVKGYVQVIKGWLHFLEDEDLISPKIRRRIKLPKVEQRLIKTLDNDCMEALLNATRYQRSEWMARRDKAILKLMLETGIRASELCSLTRECININDDPHVRVIGKGDKEREVGPLSPECCRDIRRYLRVQPRQPHDVLFVSRCRQAMTVGGLDQMLYRLRDGAGLEGTEVRAHVLRHTYAVNALRAGIDIKRLSLLMGHSSVAVTERYVRDFQQREARKPIREQPR